MSDSERATYVAQHHYISFTIVRNAQRSAAVVETGLYSSLGTDDFYITDADTETGR